MIEENWRARANCRDVDPNRMQPEVATVADVEEAKAACAGCPVFLQCWDEARRCMPGTYGVWAGEWWGQVPRSPELSACSWCGVQMDAGDRGTRAYCGAACRQRAKRARDQVEAVPA